MALAIVEAVTHIHVSVGDLLLLGIAGNVHADISAVSLLPLCIVKAVSPLTFTAISPYAEGHFSLTPHSL